MTTLMTEPEIKEGLRGHPSHFVSPGVKESDPYIRRKLQAIVAEANTGSYAMFRARAEDYAEWRAYASGDQSIDQYKKVILNPRHKRRGGKKERDNLSYKNLDWTNLAIAPKFVNVLIGRLIGQDNNIGVKAIDAKAVNARRQKQISLQEYAINRQFLEGISKTTGIKFETPIEDDVIPPPTNFQEIRLYMDMFYKEHYCLTLMDMLRLLNDQDNIAQVRKEVATDLVEVGVGATKTYRIGRRIKRRRCIPERMVTSPCKKEDFSDIEYGGEFWDLTIGELREIAQDQLSEDDLKKIAETATRQRFDLDIPTYFQQYHSYPYDHVQITVFDGFFFSPDQETYHEKRNVFGNVQVYEKEWDWMSHLSEEQFNTYPANVANGSRIYRRQMNNLYQGMLVVGTDYVFNCGKAKDMLRNDSDIGTAIGPYMIYSIKPIMKQLKPVFDSIQRNWLQYQHHINKSRPQGLDIEYTALTDMNIGGKGGEKMSPKEVLELYFDTGILLWRRRDWSGQANNWRPVNELQNGLSPAAKDHFMNVINEIDLLRSIVGLTDIASADTPNAETGKKVAEMGGSAVEDAIRYLHHAFDQINIGTAKRTVMHISAMARNGLAPDYTEAIGMESMAMLSSLSEMGMHEYGCYLIRQDTKEMKAKLQMYAQDAIKAGTLLHYEAWEIEHEENPYRAIQLLKMYHMQKMQAKQAEVQSTFQAELQKNMESARATEEEKRRTLEHEYKLKGDYEFNAARARAVENRERVRDEIILEKLKQGHEWNELLKEHQNAIDEINTKGQWDLLIQEKKAREAEAKAKEAAKKKPAAK